MMDLIREFSQVTHPTLASGLILLVSSSLVALLGAMIVHWPGWGAAARHRALLFLFLAIPLSVLTLVLPGRQAAEPARTYDSGVIETVAPSANINPNSATEPQTTEERSQSLPWLSIVGGMWLAGSTWFLLRLVRRLARASRLLAKARPITAPHGYSGVRFYVNSNAPCAMCCGLLKPAIVLPTEPPVSLTASWRAVIEHERQHLERGDLWICLLQETVVALAFFCPGVWVLRHWLATFREAACDDTAARRQSAHVLAKALLEHAVQHHPLSSHAQSIDGGGVLAWRVRRLMRGDSQFARGGLTSAGIAGSLFLAIVVLLAGLLGPRMGRADDATTVTQDVPSAASRQVLTEQAIEQIGLDARLVIADAAFAERAGLDLASDDWTRSVLNAAFSLDYELVELQRRGGGEIIASPRLITANQREAWIRQGISMSQEDSTDAGAAAEPTAVVAFQLNVEPQIIARDRVGLNLLIQIDLAGDARTQAVDTLELQTQVLLDNGQTAVFGRHFPDNSLATQRAGEPSPATNRQDGSSVILIFVKPTIRDPAPMNSQRDVPAGDDAPGDRSITLNFDQIRVEAVLQLLSEVTNQSLSYDEDCISGYEVDMTLRSAPVSQAIAQIEAQTGCEISIN